VAAPSESDAQAGGDGDLGGGCPDGMAWTYGHCVATPTDEARGGCNAGAGSAPGALAILAALAAAWAAARRKRE
jgi:MYXO-CTERM domain-containing protein